MDSIPIPDDAGKPPDLTIPFAKLGVTPKPPGAQMGLRKPPPLQDQLGAMGLPSIPDQLAEAKGYRGKEEAALQRAEQGSQAIQDLSTKGSASLKEAQAGAPQSPTLQRVPDKFEPPKMDPKETEAMLGTFMALAALGGLMTRTPVSSALGAFSGAVKGMVDGSKEVYEREYKTFSENMKTAIAKNQEAMTTYKALMEKHQNNLQTMLDSIKLEATARKDTVTQALAEAGKFREMANHIDTNVRAQVNADIALRKSDQQFQQFMQKEEARAAQAQRTQELLLARMEEQTRHNQATEANYRAKIEGASKQGLKGKAADSYVHNEANIDALEEIKGQLKENPEAFGFKTLVPGMFLNRYDPEGVPVRASLANVTSMTIKDRAGTAQTASEMKNLAPFIPRDGDDAKTVETKIDGMIKEMRRMNKFLSGGAEQATTAAAPAARAAGTPAPTNAKGWKLHVDASGNKAYVGPNNEIEEVK